MKNLLLIVVMVLVVSGGFFIWQQFGDEETTAVAISDPKLEATIQDLRRLETIQLDTALFEDPFFASLTLPIPQSPDGSLIPPFSKQGRPNPFLPF